jgi:hypothetical protein
MLFKMLGMENYWQKTHTTTGIPRPRQLFVTQSRVLADKVEEYFIKLLESLQLTGEEDSVSTESKNDGNTLRELLERKKNREDAGLVDRDENADWREDLPDKFSELNDTHFPMFITFDKVRFLKTNASVAIRAADCDCDNDSYLDCLKRIWKRRY